MCSCNLVPHFGFVHIINLDVDVTPAADLVGVHDVVKVQDVAGVHVVHVLGDDEEDGLAKVCDINERGFNIIRKYFFIFIFCIS